MDVKDWKDKLIGFGCDGTSVNIADNGLKGYLEQNCPWIVTFWCLAHCLELSIKDALKSTYFSTIDDVLMRLYYLYENSAKNVENWMMLYKTSNFVLQNLNQDHMPQKEIGPCVLVAPDLLHTR